MSKKRQEALREHRRPDGAYNVRCRRHNLEYQGRRQYPQLERRRREVFKAKLAKHALGRNKSAAVVLDMADEGDDDAKHLRDIVLGMQRLHGPRGRPWDSPGRGAAVSRGQQFKRWAEHRIGFGVCPLCGKLVHGRRYHKPCWDTWRATPEFQAERERRRWSPEKPGRRPIDSPVPWYSGRPPAPEKIAQKYGWFVQALVGETQSALARKVGLTQPTVNKGIDEFRHWVPGGGWNFVFARPAPARNLQGVFPLPNPTLRGEMDAFRMRWLLRWGMRPEVIADLLGYQLGEVYERLGEPLSYREGTMRLSRDPASRLGWSVEVEREGQWELAGVSVEDFVQKGRPVRGRHTAA